MLRNNLVRSVARESAKFQGVASDRVIVIDTLHWRVGAEGSGDLPVILIDPSRTRSVRSEGNGPGVGSGVDEGTNSSDTNAAGSIDPYSSFSFLQGFS